MSTPDAGSPHPLKCTAVRFVFTNKRRNRIKLLYFDGSSERLDPARLQFLFDEMVMGKPAPLPSICPRYRSRHAS